MHEVLAGVSRLLLKDGRFIFTILHPSFFNQPIMESPPRSWKRAVGGYLDQETWDIESFGGHRHYHRPLTWYVQQLLHHGFVITGIHEPATLPQHSRPPQDWTNYERWFSRIPTMMTIVCQHAAAAASTPRT